MEATSSPIAFDEQVVVITGAGRGLGRSYALEFARRGASVVVNDIGSTEEGGPSQSDPASEVVEELRAMGAVALASRHDASTEAETIVAQAFDRFGRIDVLINNAGISGGGPLHEITVADFARVMQVHVQSSFAMTKFAWPHLVARRGRIINTSSTSAFGLPSTAHYVTAKAAMIGLTKATALEGAPVGVIANAIMPTAYTRLTAQIEDPGFRELLAAEFSPERVAPFVAFLATPEVPCSGEVFAVGAGDVARVVLAVTEHVTSAAPQAEDYREQIERVLAEPPPDPSGPAFHITHDTIEEVGRVLTAISDRFTTQGIPEMPTTFGGDI